MVTPEPISPNLMRVFSGILGLATVIVGVVAIVYNDKLAGAGIVTAGLGITTHSLS